MIPSIGTRMPASSRVSRSAASTRSSPASPLPAGRYRRRGSFALQDEQELVASPHKSSRERSDLHVADKGKPILKLFA